ncbi:hypothetical protein EXIGLDRAFT_723902, partial [Exidia glandulosa HHB12029]
MMSPSMQTPGLLILTLLVHGVRADRTAAYTGIGVAIILAVIAIVGFACCWWRASSSRDPSRRKAHIPLTRREHNEGEGVSDVLPGLKVSPHWQPSPPS